MMKYPSGIITYMLLFLVWRALDEKNIQSTSFFFLLQIRLNVFRFEIKISSVIRPSEIEFDTINENAYLIYLMFEGVQHQLGYVDSSG